MSEHDFFFFHVNGSKLVISQKFNINPYSVLSVDTVSRVWSGFQGIAW